MKLPYGCVLAGREIIAHEEKTDVVRSIFKYYLAGASLGKIVGMLFAKGFSFSTGYSKQTKAAMEKLLVNKKSITTVGMKVYWDARSKGMQSIIPCKVLSSSISHCLISTHRNFLVHTDQIFNSIDFRYLK